MPKEQALGQPPERERPSEHADPIQTDPDNGTDLNDEITQRQYRREYLDQQRKQNCPGCGDDGSHF
jgi:hypothetical protein